MIAGRAKDLIIIRGKNYAPQEMEDLLKAIRRLPPDRQQLLILKFVEGMSNAEVATIMMRSEGAIKSLYHRTLIALRDELGKTEEKG